MRDSRFEARKVDREPARIMFNDALYPDRVRAVMGRKAPRHLDVVGNVDLLEMVGLGFCGSRKASPKGLETAKDCAEQAAQNNLAVVSGNAAGIDFEAHFNCLKAGGKTILVLPEGINQFRIRKNLGPVWDWNRALVVSQFDADDPWRVFRAMERNKLIIALSRVMILIEAREKSGTMQTGREAINLGIPLYVAQYEDMSSYAKGNHILLNRGARRLGKCKLTSRANLTGVFKTIQEDKFGAETLCFH